MMIPLGGYAGGGGPDWRPAVSIFIMAAALYLGWAAVMHLSVWACDLVGLPSFGAPLGFAISILAVISGGLRRAARHEETGK